MFVTDIQQYETMLPTVRAFHKDETKEFLVIFKKPKFNPDLGLTQIKNKPWI